MLTADQRQDLSLTLRDFPDARTLPSWVYTSPQVFANEMAKLFGQHWFCAGHRKAFAAGGVTHLELGHHSILISCSNDGELKAFHNVCRHRGTRLVDSVQHTGSLIVCPYHAWSYSLDGSLKAAPGMDKVAGFCRSRQSLLAVNLAQWEGLVFVCPGAPEQSPAELLVDFPLPVADLAGLEIVASHDYVVNANWKLLSENYNECYHCPAGHPQLHKITRPAPDAHRQRRRARFTGGPMALRDGFNTMSESGVTQRNRLPGWPLEDQAFVYYYQLFPNLFLSAVPDYVMLHLLVPRSYQQTAVTTFWLFDGAELAAADFDPSDAVNFWNLTNQQDWTLCEQAQQGQQCGVHRGGFYHPGEQCVHDFDRWYATWLSQQND